MKIAKQSAIFALAFAFALCVSASAQFRRRSFQYPQGVPTPAAPTAVIEAGQLLTGQGQALHNVKVLIENGKITAVGPDVQVPQGAIVYDLSRETVLPGLIDVHVHLTRHFGPNGSASGGRESPLQRSLGEVNNLWAILMSGFTTVQSVGEQEDVPLAQYVQEGVTPGPRILTSYQDINGSPRIGDDAMLRARVVMLNYEHADLVKIFASDSIRDGAHPTLNLHQLQVLCGEANRLGMRTLIHAYRVSVHNSIEAGCTEVEHGTFGTQADLDLMAKKGTYFDPNVGVVIQNYIEFQKRFMGNGDYDAAGFARMKDAITLNNDFFLKAIHTPGVKVVSGSDAVAGAFHHLEDELIQRIHLGQPAMDAIDTATSVSAGSLRLGDQIGTLKAGYIANIIALDGDPLQDAQALRHVSFVMKAGRVYKYTVSAAKN